VALAHAQASGGSEAIFANTAGDLCEGTGSNVFYVVDGELRTPTLASGCLAGVTRGLVLDWCGAREVDEPIAVAEAADEVFLVSTTRDVQAVTRWGTRELEVGAITRSSCCRCDRRGQGRSVSTIESRSSSVASPPVGTSSHVRTRNCNRSAV
jgi:branched-chain amino acid aminotransferase